MKTLIILTKCLREQLRDFWGLALTLSAAPFFVLIYALMFSGMSSSYKIGVLNLDEGAKLPEAEQVEHFGQAAIEALKETKREDGSPVLQVVPVDSEATGRTMLANRELAALAIIPRAFSASTVASMQGGEAPVFKLVGDIGNPQYMIAAVMAYSAVEEMIVQITKAKRPMIFEEDFIGSNAKSRNDFELSVPGLLIFAIIILLYTASMAMMREVEDRTITRLMLTPMRVAEYLGGIGIAQVLIGFCSIALTFAVAAAFGFRSEGSFLTALVISVLCISSIVGISLIVVSFCKSTGNVLTLGTFPMFILMFLSGAMMPLPQAELFKLGSHAVAANALLPPTHAVTALNKVFLSGAGLGELWFEIIWLVALTIGYSAIGLALFQKRHLRAA